MLSSPVSYSVLTHTVNPHPLRRKQLLHDDLLVGEREDYHSPLGLPYSVLTHTANPHPPQLLQHDLLVGEREDYHSPLGLATLWERSGGGSSQQPWCGCCRMRPWRGRKTGRGRRERREWQGQGQGQGQEGGAIRCYVSCGGCGSSGRSGSSARGRQVGTARVLLAIHVPAAWFKRLRDILPLCVNYRLVLTRGVYRAYSPPGQPVTRSDRLAPFSSRC